MGVGLRPRSSWRRTLCSVLVLLSCLSENIQKLLHTDYSYAFADLIFSQNPWATQHASQLSEKRMTDYDLELAVSESLKNACRKTMRIEECGDPNVGVDYNPHSRRYSSYAAVISASISSDEYFAVRW